MESDAMSDTIENQQMQPALDCRRRYCLRDLVPLRNAQGREAVR